MINDEKKYELVKYEDGGISIDLKLDTSTNTIWLTQNDMALLFNIDRTRITKTIKSVLENNPILESNVQKMHIPFSDKLVKIYDLNIVLEIGKKLNSLLQEKFYKWAKDKLAELNDKNRKNGVVTQFITFNYNEISLDVNVSPDEDTVWLTKDQLALLFESTRQNVEYHINNIYIQKELEEKLTCKKILHFTDTYSRYESRSISVYNLDMIISLGYRINSKNGIIFRQWANKVLKEYLLKGSAIDEKRCIVCESNILDLQNKYNKIIKRLDEEKSSIYSKPEIIFFEGENIESYTFFRNLFFLAKKELIIIDGYADKLLLAMLNEIKVNITIITNKNSYLNGLKTNSNIKIINTSAIHGRYIIADDYVYLLDNSINNIGKQRFIVVRLYDISKEYILKDIKL